MKQFFTEFNETDRCTLRDQASKYTNEFRDLYRKCEDRLTIKQYNYVTDCDHDSQSYIARLERMIDATKSKTFKTLIERTIAALADHANAEGIYRRYLELDK